MTRRLLLWLLRAVATLATLALLLVVGVLWYGHTQDALERAVAEVVARSGGRLEVKGAAGSVLGPFGFARIAWKDATTSVVAEDVHGEWSPRALLYGRLQIAELTVGRLSASAATQSQSAGLPESLALPLRLAVDRLSIATLELDANGAVAGASAIELAYVADETGHHVRGLRLNSTIGSINADVDVGAQPPFVLGGKLGLSRPDVRAPIDASAMLGGVLAAPKLAFQATVGAAKVDGVGTLLPFESSWLQELSLNANAVDLAQLRPEWPGTDLALAANAATTPEGTIAGSLDIVNAAAGTLTDHRLPVQRTQSAFRVEDGQLRLSGLRIAVSGGGSATGSATIGSNRTELDLAISAVDLRSIHGPLRSTRLGGSLRAQIADDSVTARAQVREKDLSLALDLVQRGNGIELRQFRAEARGGSLEGSGRLALTGPKAFSVNARAARLNPAAFGDFVLASIDAEIAATGALEPQWSADVRFKIDEHSRLRGVRLAGNGHLAASPARVRDVDLRLHVASNALEVHGAFGQAGDHLDFTLDVPRLKQLDPAFDGKLSASGSISGSVAAPAVSFEVRGNALRAGERYSIASLTATGKIATQADGQALAEIAAKEFATPQFELAVASLSVQGTMSSHEAEFKATGPRVDALLKIRGGWHGGDLPHWQGSVVAFEQRGDIPVTLTRPVTMEVARDRALVSDVALRVATGQVTVRHFRWEGHRFSSEGEFTGIPAALPMQLAAVGHNVRSTLLLGGDWSVAASPRMNGTLRVRRESGDLAARDIAGLALGLTVLDVDARLDNDALTATLSATSAQFGTANIRLAATPPAGTEGGTLGRDAPARLVASFQLASLRAIEVFTGTSAVVDGRLRASLEGQGTLGALTLSGQIDGDDLRIDAPQYGVAVHDGRLRAELRGDELRVNELMLAAGSGQFTATGTLPLRLDAAAPSTVRWKADKFTLLNRPDARLVLDGSGALTLEARRLSLNGNLRAVEGHFEFAARDTTRLSDDVVVIGRQGTALENGLGTSAKIPLRLDLDLDLGPRLTVIGHGFDARLEGRVQVTTSDDGTLLARGRVTAVNGTYLAFGQRLVLDRGDVYFDGPIDNPSLNILALRRNLPVEVGIAITGTAKAPRAVLTSNPPLPDGEKLSWLVLGHGGDRTAGNDNAALQSAAALLFGSTIGGAGGTTLASRFGLDDMSVHGRAGGAEGQVVSFGRRIADRLYIAIDHGLTIATNALRIEYSLSRSWMLRAEAGVVSSFGIYYTESFR